ncbi:MAG: hypothetical protein WC889_09470, partial [Myxococcota bacterium]
MSRELEEAGEESFESMLGESMQPGRKHVAVGEKVEARVVSIGSETVFLDVGTRADGGIPKPDLIKDGELTVKVGDVITVFAVGRREGMMMFTRRLGSAGSDDRKGGNEAALSALREAYEAHIPIEGHVKEVIKGGFSVTIMGQRTFCPISQIEKGFCEHPEEHLNQ